MKPIVQPLVTKFYFDDDMSLDGTDCVSQAIEALCEEKNKDGDPVYDYYSIATHLLDYMHKVGIRP